MITSRHTYCLIPMQVFFICCDSKWPKVMATAWEVILIGKNPKGVNVRVDIFQYNFVVKNYFLFIIKQLRILFYKLFWI